MERPFSPCNTIWTMGRICYTQSFQHNLTLLMVVFLKALSALGLCRNTAAAAAKSLQLCLTLCDPIDGSPPGSPVPGILQARTLEWVAISFSSAWKWKVKVKSLSRVWFLVTPWTAAYQAPLSMGFSRQQYWSGVPLPSPTYAPTCNLYSALAPYMITTYIQIIIN